jgi:uncharacterized protein (DUF2126 family)
MLDFKTLVALFWDALSAHETEEAAEDDVAYVADAATELGIDLTTVVTAYEVALKG